MTPCSCPACNGSTEADFGAFVCSVRENAAKARRLRCSRVLLLQAQRHNLTEARKHRVAAASGRWDRWTTDFHARTADLCLHIARRNREARLTLSASV